MRWFRTCGLRASPLVPLPKPTFRFVGTIESSVNSGLPAVEALVVSNGDAVNYKHTCMYVYLFG